MQGGSEYQNAVKRLLCSSLQGLPRTFTCALPRVDVSDGLCLGPRGHGEELVARDGLGPHPLRPQFRTDVESVIPRSCGVFRCVYAYVCAG